MMKIFVVEDNSDFAKDAKDDLGARVFATHADFIVALRDDKPDVVLSDLYFPTGYVGTFDTNIRAESASIIGKYVVSIDRPNPLGKTVDLLLSTVFVGKTLEDYIEMMKEDSVVKKFKDEISERYRENERIKQYKELAEKIKDGSHDPPSGMFVYRDCSLMKIPCMIVTSAYHHGIEFQPFVSHVGRYMDQLVDGRKPWKRALEAVIGR